jgi:orotidine-5'-phosphate decarboxylase
MTFTERLRAVQQAQNSLLCVGLDTDAEKIPSFLSSHENPVAEFNRRIIEATREFVCAYKVNLAFYEVLGPRSWDTLQRTLSFIPRELITIGDAKRGDIGNSSSYYARVLFDELDFGAATLNPYMGFDSVEPFLRRRERGAFVLALTSNPGAKDFQYLRVNKRPLYEHVIRKVKGWNREENCGLVVGATRPGELKKIRDLVPGMPILIPGVGAQGGDLEKAVRHGCDRTGLSALINASRTIIYASAGEDFADAARRQACEMRDAINRHRERFFTP